MKHLSKSIPETAGIAAEVLKRISTKEKQGATVLALYGDLGSGKTTFVQQLGKQLGITETIQSPTFVIMKRYVIHASRFTNIFHIDAYRLEKPEELARLGWVDILKEKNNLIVVEWAEQVEALLPEDSIRIKFKFVDETTREVEMVE